MKIFSSTIVVILTLLFSGGCANKGSGKKDASVENDPANSPDSVVQYFSNQVLLKEVSFKNGVRNGLTRTYYRGGQLYQTFWYVNDLREDSSGYYYLEGQLFRSTPYKHDTIDGIQRQYYRTGEIKAKIGYSKGLRTPYFEEFTKEGKRVKGYPDIVTEINDEYNSSGKYSINLSLSDNNKKVKFYRGEFTDNRFDTAKCQLLKTIDGRATLILKKTGTPKRSSLGIISEFTTGFANRYLVYKKIDLPYNDLN
jgi:antitoxin component YwqK of YwqJK toxin-antitoxin module